MLYLNSDSLPYTVVYIGNKIVATWQHLVQYWNGFFTKTPELNLTS